MQNKLCNVRVLSDELIVLGQKWSIACVCAFLSTAIRQSLKTFLLRRLNEESKSNCEAIMAETEINGIQGMCMYESEDADICSVSHQLLLKINWEAKCQWNNQSFSEPFSVNFSLIFRFYSFVSLCPSLFLISRWWFRCAAYMWLLFSYMYLPWHVLLCIVCCIPCGIRVQSVSCVANNN